MDNLELLRINKRLEGISAAQKRTRFTFIVTVIIALAVTITLWNAYLSWDRDFATQTKWHGSNIEDGSKNKDNSEKKVGSKNEHGSKKADGKSEDEVCVENHKTLLSEWVKSQIITVPLLGIRVGVSDASVLSGISLFIVSIWFFFSMRQENYLVATLLIDTKEHDLDLKKLIISTILSHFVFTSVSKNDQPINDLTPLRDEYRKISFTRKIDKYLFFLPPTAIALAIIMDILSIFLIPAVFRYPKEPLLHIMNGAGVWIKFVLFEMVALTFLILTSFVCWRSLKYEKATVDILNRYRDSIKTEKEQF